MAWDYCSEEDVLNYTGFAVEDIKEEWSDEVEDMINDRLGKNFASPVAYTESYDGDGTDTLFLNRYPVSSVSSVAISGTTVATAEYKVYDRYIRLVQGAGTAIQKAIGDADVVFPVGVQNVEVSYSAGAAAVPGRVRLCATAMIAQIAMVAKRGGSDAIIPATRASREFGTTPRQTRMDVSSKLQSIMDHYIGDRVRFS